MSLRKFFLIATVLFGLSASCSRVETSQAESPVNDVLPTAPLPLPSPKPTSVCANPESGWAIEKLHGRVQLLTAYEIDYQTKDKKKELTRQVSFTPDGDYVKVDERWIYSSQDYRKLPKVKLTFDDQCRVIERIGPETRAPGSRTVRATKSYSNTGRVIAEKLFDMDGHLLWSMDAKVDDSGFIIATEETTQVHPEHFKPPRYDQYVHTKSTFENDKSGNPIEQLDWKFDGTFYATYTMAYDDQGRLIRKLRLDSKDRPIDLKIYKFDEKGRLTEDYEYHSAEYGAIDELLPGKLDSGFGMFQAGTRSIYEFDAQNNWIKKTEFDLMENGQLSRETFRKIIYY